MPNELDTSNEIKNYEEYLSIFFPGLIENNEDTPTTPEEIGMKMAEETLIHIQSLLLDNNTD